MFAPGRTSHTSFVIVSDSETASKYFGSWLHHQYVRTTSNWIYCTS